MLYTEKTKRRIFGSIKEHTSKKNFSNKIKILEHLHQVRSSTLNDISKAANLSIPTALLLTGELTEEQWIEDKGLGGSIGGRKPQLIGMKDDIFYILSIDIELYKVQVAVLDNNLNTKTTILSIPYILSKSRAEFKKVVPAIKKFLADNKIGTTKLSSVSIGMPGLIDIKGNNLTYMTDGEKDQSLREFFETSFALPAVLQNDVKGIAQGELYAGKARGKQNVLTLLMDLGVGLGIVMDGKLRLGSAGYSGEFGHIPYTDGGELCYCGKQGCLETVASGLAITKKARKEIAAGQISILKNLCKGDTTKISLSLLMEAVDLGDQYAIKLVSDTGFNMGKVISILIQIFNPEMIILGGELSKAKQYITIPMLHAINTYCMSEIREKVTITSSELGTNAKLIGYAAEAINRLLTV